MADNKKQFIGKDRLNDILTWLHTWLGNNVPKVVHLTWAEYQDLPDTKYTDGVEYWIDDAPTGASTLLVSLTEAEYLAIPETTRINSDKLYFVYDVDSVWESGDVRYKNTTVKAALDRLVPEVFLTKAEFDLLKASGGLYPGTKYTQTDEQYDFKSEAISYGSSDVKTALDTINQNITNIHEWNLIGTISASPSVSTSATLNIPTNAKEMMLMLKDVGYDDVLDVEIVPMGYGNATGINLYFFSTSGSVYRLIITRNSNTFTVNNTSVANFEVKVFTR